MKGDQLKILQILPTISYGDAVGNDTIAIKKVIEEMGYETGIYAENIDKRYVNSVARKIDKIPKLNKDDILIYHKSTGTDLSFTLDKYNCRKIMIYHNITPPEFFSIYSKESMQLTKKGIDGLIYLKDKIDYCLAVSEFNKKDLIDIGYDCKIDVRPILIPFEDYEMIPDKNIISKYDDDWVNIVFVGRIAPNKKQEDLIKSFYYYKKFINKNSRLFIVGSYNGMNKYYNNLRTYADALEIDDVYFTGHVKFNEILSYYKLADVFLCMSEHEGFCVPLVEAMHFKVPVIAYNSSAIPDTLNGSGIIVDEKDPVFIAKLIHRMVTDVDLRNEVIKRQTQKLSDFSYDVIKEKFVSYLDEFIKKGDIKI